MCLLVKLFASVAQLVEQLTCNQLVGGSSPSTGSNLNYLLGIRDENSCFIPIDSHRRGCAGVGEPG